MRKVLITLVGILMMVSFITGCGTGKTAPNTSTGTATTPAKWG